MLLSVQYLRGLAALGVVLNHVNWTHWGIGAAGVDVFFIISGFIMQSISRRESSPWFFIRARITRVVPLYWLATMVSYPVWRDARLGHLFASMLFVPIAGDGEWLPVLVPGWTLQFEMFFYTIFMATLLLRRSQRFLFVCGMFSLIALTVSIAAPSVLQNRSITPLFLVEFIAGMTLCKLRETAWRPSAALGFGVLLVGLAGMALSPHGDQLPWRPVTWGGPSLLIVAGALIIEDCGWMPRIPLLKQVGDWSYALYLTHMVVIWAAIPFLQPLPLVVALPLLMSVCVAAAALVHQWVELPLLSLLRSRKAKALSVM